MNGLISAGLENTAIICSPKETLIIDTPVGFIGTCNTYLAPYCQAAGGLLLNPEASLNCQYCPVSDANSLLKSLGIDTSAGWKNMGYLTVFIAFNILATFVLYWLARISRKHRQDI
jgi:ATP-binding cassette, subfamily G (WHITE), member 2, PDR